MKIFTARNFNKLYKNHKITVAERKYLTDIICVYNQTNSELFYAV